MFRNISHTRIQRMAEKKHRLHTYIDINDHKLYIKCTSYSTPKHLLRINDWQNALGISQLTDGISQCRSQGHQGHDELKAGSFYLSSVQASTWYMIQQERGAPKRTSNIQQLSKVYSLCLKIAKLHRCGDPGPVQRVLGLWPFGPLAGLPLGLLVGLLQLLCGTCWDQLHCENSKARIPKRSRFIHWTFHECPPHIPTP